MTQKAQNSPLVTLTIFGYAGAGAKLWALARMGVAGFELKKTAGLRFFKLLGSGDGGGFSLKPDWSRYALLCVWDDERAADEFFQTSKLMEKYRRRASEIWTARLAPTRAHGAWSGANPFLPVVDAPPESAPVAVLTRAAIRPAKLARFWSFVPATSREIERAPGLIASIGVGEAPFVRQATFSLWQTEAAMKDFAYKSEMHREVVKLTRTENWYAEELFARFSLVSSEGAWNGRNPSEEWGMENGKRKM